MLDELEIHVRCMDFQDNYLIALKRHDLLSDRIYQGYTRYIPCIYQTYTIQRSLASPLSCPSALGSLGQGLPLDLLSLGHWEAAHTRLGRCISVQKAWNERDLAEEVLNPSDEERGNRWGLVHPVNSFRFHDSSCPQAKFLKAVKVASSGKTTTRVFYEIILKRFYNIFKKL